MRPCTNQLRKSSRTASQPSLASGELRLGRPLRGRRTGSEFSSREGCRAEAPQANAAERRRTSFLLSKPDGPYAETAYDECLLLQISADLRTAQKMRLPVTCAASEQAAHQTSTIDSIGTMLGRAATRFTTDRGRSSRQWSFQMNGPRRASSAISNPAQAARLQSDTSRQ